MHSDPSLEQLRSAPPEDLVLMLYEGAFRFGHEARAALLADDPDRAHELVGRVRAIVAELDRSLNRDAGSISRHLAAIYDYVLRRLEPAEIDAAALDEVIADLGVLCQAWTSLVAGRVGVSHVRSHRLTIS
jgi:flagellar secretion chaperone FliS